MADRENEINFVADMINRLCVEANICIYPKKLKSGIQAVVIHDNETNKDYALMKKDKQNDI